MQIKDIEEKNMKLEEKKDRLEEVENVIDTIDVLIIESNSEDIIEDLENFKSFYLQDMHDLEKEINALEEQEIRQMNREFEGSRL